MKLRNKKTGKIITSKEILTDEFLIDLFSKDFNYFISKLNKLQQEWEYVKEPLIKDKNIRKAVRAWSYINCVDEIVYAERDDGSLCNLIDASIEDTSISFVGWIPTLKDGKEYTIAELCGRKNNGR